MTDMADRHDKGSHFGAIRAVTGKGRVVTRGQRKALGSGCKQKMGKEEGSLAAWTEGRRRMWEEEHVPAPES